MLVHVRELVLHDSTKNKEQPTANPCTSAAFQNIPQSNLKRKSENDQINDYYCTNLQSDGFKQFPELTLTVQGGNMAFSWTQVLQM